MALAGNFRLKVFQRFPCVAANDIIFQAQQKGSSSRLSYLKAICARV